MRTPVLAANWKMHHGPTEAREFIQRFLTLFPSHEDRTVIICPPAVAIEAVSMAIGDRRDIQTAVQNIWTESKGAFTGELSAEMAADAGARYALVGHSERRHIFGETNEQTAVKCLRAFEAGLTPMLCVGETITQRENGTTETVVLEQLRSGLSRLNPDQIRCTPIAYEPVWAIGTGKTATPADASAVHAVIRSALADAGDSGSANHPILYGGSVNEANAGSLLDSPGIDGLLVGGASLDPNSWARICAT
jgi:triosephosphate isomerase